MINWFAHTILSRYEGLQSIARRFRRSAKGFLRWLLFGGADFGEALPEKVGQWRFDIERDQPDGIHVSCADAIFVSEDRQLHTTRSATGVYKELQSVPPGGTWRESFWIVPEGF